MKQNTQMLRLNMTLKVFTNGRWERVCSTHSRSRFLRKLPHAVGEKYYLLVTYAPGIFNDGEYKTKKELRFAFECFTNRDGVEFIARYNDLTISP